MPDEKDHKYFFGQNPEIPGQSLIWSGELWPGDIEAWAKFGDILDSLRLEGLTLGNGLCMTSYGDTGYALWFVG